MKVKRDDGFDKEMDGEREWVVMGTWVLRVREVEGRRRERRDEQVRIVVTFA